jgi:hypothetical protein
MQYRLSTIFLVFFFVAANAGVVWFVGAIGRSGRVSNRFLVLLEAQNDIGGGLCMSCHRVYPRRAIAADR